MKFLLRFFFQIKKKNFFFNNPAKKNLLVFDDMAIFELNKILAKRDFFILKSRPDQINEFYLTFKFFFYFLLNLNKGFLLSYIITLIKIIKPKVIITFIDNSLIFSEIAKIFKKKKIKFIAIQNASRYDFALNNYCFKRKLIKQDINKRYYIPILCCFGNYEILTYKKFGIKVGKFYKYGSLRLSNYLNFKKINKINKINKVYDIAVLSQDHHVLDNLLNKKNIDSSFSKVAKYAIKYCKENNLKFLFILKRPKSPDSKLELNYYKKNLSASEFKYLKDNSIKPNRKNFAAYKAIEKSRLVISTHSTMLREKLELKGKILSCNFSNLEIFDFPIKNIGFIKNPSYEEFQNRVNIILKISNKKYFKHFQNNKLTSIIKHELTFDKINKLIDKVVSN